MATMSSDGDVARLAAQCAQLLGPTDSWTPPDGYPDGLALCIIDAVWSMGVRYGGVRRVVRRYRALRTEDGAAPDVDGARDLIAAIERTGGPDAFSAEMGNRHRTSTRSGILKTEAVLLCARALAATGVDSAADLRDAVDPMSSAAEQAWRAVPGQGSGISWRYVRMLADVQEVKPDRMITRFVAGALGRIPTPDEAAALVTAVAAGLNVDLRGLDHRIWRFQSGRG
jgi:hypothetical protein